MGLIRLKTSGERSQRERGGGKVITTAMIANTCMQEVEMVIYL